MNLGDIFQLNLSLFSTIIASYQARGYGNTDLARKLLEVAYRDGNWVLLGTTNSAFL